MKTRKNFHCFLVLLLSTLVVSAQTYNWTTIAGSGGLQGTNDGSGSLARFNAPWGVAADGGGNVYVAELGNQLIRMLTPAGLNWNITTIAGDVNAWHDVDGTNNKANFFQPYGIAADSGTPPTLYIVDQNQNYAGSARSLKYLGSGIWQSALLAKDFAGGLGAQPVGVAVNGAGELFIPLVIRNGVIYVRQPGANWIYSTITGSGLNNYGTADGTNTQALFNGPAASAVDAGGNVYIGDTQNHTIRKISLISGTTNWVTTTIAGTAGIPGNADGPALSAQFNGPDGIAVDASGNIYVADANNNVIRKLTPQGNTWTVSTIGGQLNRAHGTADGVGVASSFYHPAGIAVDGQGRLFVCDYLNNTIRMGTPSAAVNPPPLVQLTASGGSAYVMWPLSSTNFSLQTATNPAGPWQNLNSGIVTNLVFSGPMTNTQTYYRLVQ